MTNKEVIEKKLATEGLELGCWDNKMEQLDAKALREVVSNMIWAEDTDVMIKGKLHVVEIDEVDGEIDFSVLTQEEYISRYGDERWDEE